MNNKGQSVLSEYVIIFLLVIAALVAVSTYVQRGLEARVHDARNFMINSVINSGACDANCINATGGNIFYEYEPYYEQTLSLQQHNETDTTALTNSNSPEDRDISNASVNAATQSNATSNQLPPGCADGANPKPAYCAEIQLPSGT